MFLLVRFLQNFVSNAFSSFFISVFFRLRLRASAWPMGLPFSALSRNGYGAGKAA